MKRNHFLQLIIVCFCMLLGAHANGSVDSQKAVSWVNAKGRELLETFNDTDINKKHQKLDEMFINHVDLNYISKFVIGKYWRSMTDSQKQKYQDLFKRYCLGVYKNFPLNFKNKITFSVINAHCNNDYCDVITNIDIGEIAENEQTQIFMVTFRIRENNNVWKIIDLKLAESSLLLSYRNRFYEMISAVDGEIDWFLEDFENSLSK